MLLALRALGQAQRADRVGLLQAVGGEEAEVGGPVGQGDELRACGCVVAAGGQRAGAKVLPLLVLLQRVRHRRDRRQHGRPVHPRQRHPRAPFAGAVVLRGGGQRREARQCVVVEIGGVEQRQRAQDVVALRRAEGEAWLQLPPRGVGAGHVAPGQPHQGQRGRLPCARRIRPVRRLDHRGGRIAQGQRQLLRVGLLIGGQPLRQAGDGASLAGVGGAVDARPQSRGGQQALALRGVEHRVAGVGQVRLRPQRGQVAIEVQRGALRQLRLQGVATQRVAEACLVQREKAAPVLPPRQLAQKTAAQIRGGNPVGVLREVGLDGGAVDGADVVFQRRRRQVGIQRIVTQGAGKRAPVAALLGRRIGLLEGGALCRRRFGGARVADEQADASQQQAARARQAGRGGNRHGYSAMRSAGSVVDGLPELVWIR
ncbi:hypothetical protein [Rhodanobacter lindaniclasticus]